MYNFIVHVISFSFVLFGSTNCGLSYDQRQTGELNVQIGLKNIQLIALLKGGTEEYVDYDYAYDYSEMTIKPQHGTTSKPNVTTTQNQSNVITTPITSVEKITKKPNVIATEQINGTELSNNVTGTTLNATTDIAADSTNQTSENLESADYSRMTTIKQATDAEVFTTVVPDTQKNSSASPVGPSNCRRGFVQNYQGKCEYKVQGTSNALRKIVKLAQKIKIGRGVKGT